MVLDLRLAHEAPTFVDPREGVVDRRIFADEQIYRLELEQIFARAWLFMCHDSQIPNAGDFFMTSMGEDRVICVRDRDGNPQVLVNSCRHRGNAVCRAEEGNNTSFMCTYHGWTYDLDGKLIGVPGYKEVYHEELDRDQWGLLKAAQVDSYKGFIFATMDPEAPSLADYLGDVGRLSIDLIAEHGTNVALNGVQKYTIPCNWKFAADNVWDYYHPAISHASSRMSGWSNQRKTKDGEPPPPPQPNEPYISQQVVIPGEYGHVIAGPTVEGRRTQQPSTLGDQAWRERPGVAQTLGPVGMQVAGHPHIFPNMWMTGNQVSMRYPKGVGSTEIWWFTFLASENPAELRETQRRGANHVFGPAGMLEQDDGENWGESTRAMTGVVSRRHPLHYGMRVGTGTLEDDEQGPPRIWSGVNEHAQLWYYRAWAEWLAAPSWSELKNSHLTPEGRL